MQLGTGYAEDMKPKLQALTIKLEGILGETMETKLSLTIDPGLEQEHAMLRRNWNSNCLQEFLAGNGKRL
jgi:hypothetical protein